MKRDSGIYGSDDRALVGGILDKAFAPPPVVKVGDSRLGAARGGGNTHPAIRVVSDKRDSRAKSSDNH